MLFNEKYAISHISYNTGRIIIEYQIDEELKEPEENFEGLIRAFSRLTGRERESLGMMQYRVGNLPFEFIFQLEIHDGIVIVIEDMRIIDDAIKYIKNSLYDINYNMLYQNRDIY